MSVCLLSANFVPYCDLDATNYALLDGETSDDITDDNINATKMKYGNLRNHYRDKYSDNSV